MNVSAIAKNTRHLAAKVPTTATVGLVALATASLPFVSEVLQYDRGRIMAGELWRLVTCHVTHWNAEHFLWDLLMFVVLGAWCEWRQPKQMRMCLVLGAAAVTGTVFFFFPDINAYRGLSGVDTALFTLLAVELFREGRQAGDRWQCLVTAGLLVGFVGKILYEAIVGGTIFVDEQAAGFVPLVWDHLAGAVVGIVVALAPWPSSQRPAALMHVNA